MATINPVDDPQIFRSESRANEVIVAVSLLMGIATLVVSLRIYTRHFMLSLFGWDDFLTLVSLGLLLADGIAMGLLTKQGLGRHVGTLPQPYGLKNYLQNFYITVVLYVACVGSIKLAFLVQYYRVLAKNTGSRLRQVIVVLAILISCWSASQVFVGIFFCYPVSAFWDQSVKGTCIKQTTQFYLNAGGNIVTDVIIFVLPIPVLYRLKLPGSQKLGLLGVFCLGFFTTVISFVRIRYLNLDVDTTFVNTDSSIWSLTELCSGVVCLCLPCLRPLLVRFVPDLATRLSSKHQSPRYVHSSLITFGRRSVRHKHTHDDEELGLGRMESATNEEPAKHDLSNSVSSEIHTVPDSLTDYEAKVVAKPDDDALYRPIWPQASNKSDEVMGLPRAVHSVSFDQDQLPQRPAAAVHPPERSSKNGEEIETEHNIHVRRELSTHSSHIEIL